MKYKINKPILFALLFFLAPGPVLAGETWRDGNLHNNYSKPSSEEFNAVPKQHSLVLNFGGALADDFSNDFNYHFIGLNYELRLYDFLGISLNWKMGVQYLDENDRYEFNEKFEPVFTGWQYYRTNTQVISFSPKFYLNLFPEAGFWLFGEFAPGLYFLKSEGKVTPEQGEEFESTYTANPHFYYGINIGAEILISNKVAAWATLGGENIDYKSPFNNLGWQQESWVNTSPPKDALVFSFGFKFYL
mgnify:FL=1